jgi:hypothetical protein
VGTTLGGEGSLAMSGTLIWIRYEWNTVGKG